MRRHLSSEIEKALVSMIETIMLEHVGAGHAIKGARLLTMLRAYEPILGDRKMRRMIEWQLPHICSSPKGYFLARDDNEARPAVEYLTSYIKGLARRRSAILVKYPEAGQGTLGI